MTYIQLNFFIFLIATVIVFYICPVKHRWIVLLLSSIVFYCISGVKYLPFIIFTSLTIFLVARAIGQKYALVDQEIEEKGLDRKAARTLKNDSKIAARKYMLIGLILNIGILAFIKITRMIEAPLNTAILNHGGTHFFYATSWLIVPLGISYYTFSCVSYLLDVYWRRVDYEKNYARFLLYAIYFPHILQGPIERYGRLGQRLKGEFRWDYDRVCKGVQLMMWGFFKKLVMADRINIFLDGVYAEGSNACGFVYLVSFFLDIIYIYTDFSGCMDIARGASEIFGVEMDLNFNHPFMSKNIVEFWRRWHMSLGGWFREYVYYPISTSSFTKNLNKKCRGKMPDLAAKAIITIVPVTVTWVLTGLWHGTGKTYVAWGLYYSFMIFISVTFGEVFQSWNKKLHINTEAWSWKLFQMIRTTCVFGFGRFLTRPGSLHATLNALISIVKVRNYVVFIDGGLYSYGITEEDFLVIIFSTLLLIIVSAAQERGIKIRDTIARQNIWFRWIVYFCAFFAVIILGIYGPSFSASDFVYMAY